MLSSVLVDDLVIEILAKLPVKSIVRFKCVAKSWLALFKDSFFITKHLNFAASSQSLLIYYAYNSLLTNVSASITEPHIKVKTHFKRRVVDSIEILGPYNGIFCIIGSFDNGYQNYGFTCGYEIVLWNPATRETKHLPEVMPRQVANSMAYAYNFGFCIDPNTNDVNVVTVMEVSESIYVRSPRNQVVVEVYNLGIDSNWRPISTNLEPLIGFPFHKTRSRCSINGIQYWLTDLEGHMLSLHLAGEEKEQFRWILLPPVHEFKSRIIAVSNGSLIFVTPQYGYCDVWVMNHKVDDVCWTKLFKVRLSNDICPTNNLLTVWKDDLISESYIFTYEVLAFNMRSQVRKTIDIKDVLYCSEAFAYTESLFVLNCARQAHDELEME